MEKYVIFTGPAQGGDKLAQASGYLAALVDQDILSRPQNTKEMWNEGHIDDLKYEFNFELPDDLRSALADELKEKGRFIVVGAKVIDQDSLEKLVPSFVDRYGLVYQIYEAASND